MKRLLFVLIAICFICIGKSYAYYDQYIIGVSSGIAVSSAVFTNALAIKAGDYMDMNIDGMKLCCDGDATFEIVIATGFTGGYNAVINTAKPIGLGLNNKFSAKADTTAIADSILYFKQCMRLQANQVLDFSEYVGRLSVTKGFVMIIRVKADSENKKFYPMIRVWDSN